MATRRQKSDERPGKFSEGSEEDVRTRAYELYEARGREPGHEWEDWLQAEREVRPKHEEQ